MLEQIKLQELQRVGEMITRTIDFQESKASGRTIVARGVDLQLDNLKDTYSGLSDFLDEARRGLLTHGPEWARRYILECEYVPQLGFLTVLSLDPETIRSLQDGQNQEGDDWQPVFRDRNKTYYSNDVMRDLDRTFGDLHCIVAGETNRASTSRHRSA